MLPCFLKEAGRNSRSGNPERRFYQTSNYDRIYLSEICYPLHPLQNPYAARTCLRQTKDDAAGMLGTSPLSSRGGDPPLAEKGAGGRRVSRQFPACVEASACAGDTADRSAGRYGNGRQVKLLQCFLIRENLQLITVYLRF